MGYELGDWGFKIEKYEIYRPVCKSEKSIRRSFSA